MVRPPPISLRIHRNAEATRHARALLRRLDEGDRLQRRIKWMATKAQISIREMMSIAAQLPGDRTRWRAECERIQTYLENIKTRGV